jgi:hypothetical protein
VKWSFTPDEFAHIWRETDLDVYPYPVQIIETPRTANEAAVLRRSIEKRLPLKADPELSTALRIVADPEIRIAAIGGSEGDDAKRIRILGSIESTRAVLVVQQPGITAAFGSVVRVSLFHTRYLAERVVGQLPTTARGNEPRRSAPMPDVRNNKVVITSDPKVKSVPGQIRRLLSAPRTAEGHFRIETKLHDDYPSDPKHLTWVDIAKDGRYLIHTDGELKIAPVSTESVAAYLQKLIAR